jgi:NADP-dependent 3-hydroxy acid dehydrogenase YdfG
MARKLRLKPLNEQVIVITGATSGIGLVTTRMAARKGARLVIGARAEDAVRQLESELNSSGGRAIGVTVDVASIHG